MPGTCLTVTLEGRRPLVAEVQALTVDIQIPSPRRTTSGLETSRVSMMLAVLEQRGPDHAHSASGTSTARRSAA